MKVERSVAGMAGLMAATTDLTTAVLMVEPMGPSLVASMVERMAASTVAPLAVLRAERMVTTWVAQKAALTVVMRAATMEHLLSD